MSDTGAITVTFFTNYDIFSGSGMAQLGLGVSWRCLFANDNNSHFLKTPTYRANFNSAPELKVCDVERLTTADLPGHADLAWASSPCQDVSIAGDRAGLSGSRSNAFWRFWKLMLGLRAEGRAPKLIVIENVVGLITSNGGADFDAVLEAMAAGGYNVGVLVIDAGLFQPQSRKRVFIVGVDEALPIPADLIADGPSLPFYPPVLIEALRRQVQPPVWWALPIPPQRNMRFADMIEDDPVGVPASRFDKTDELFAMMAPKHLDKVEAAKRSGRRMVGSLSTRMRAPPGVPDVSANRVQRPEIRFDDVAGCLRVPSGGSSRQAVMIVDGDKVSSRLLSGREYARLMGLPDSYVLPHDHTQALAVCGDGVVVDVVKHLSENLFVPLILNSPALVAGE